MDLTAACTRSAVLLTITTCVWDRKRGRATPKEGSSLKFVQPSEGVQLRAGTTVL